MIIISIYILSISSCDVGHRNCIHDSQRKPTPVIEIDTLNTMPGYILVHAHPGRKVLIPVEQIGEIVDAYGFRIIYRENSNGEFLRKVLSYETFVQIQTLIRLAQLDADG